MPLPRIVRWFTILSNLTAQSATAINQAQRFRTLSDRLFGKRRDTGIVVLLIAFLVIGVAVGVYLTGGTQFVYLQFMYIPVALAGLIFGMLGGVVFGLFAGLILGPVMPLNVDANLSQPLLSWLIRLGFLCVQGLLAGYVGGMIKQRLRVVEIIAEELALTYGRILRSLVALIGERDDKTADHSERVAYNAIQMGQALHLNADELETLYWAAVLHDLGKIGVPEKILNHPGALSSEDRAQMQRHVEIGQRILEQASVEFKPIAEIVATHHERWDGLGYPKGLKGKEIPLAGRILTVLDVFEALTSKRPYREPMLAAEALHLIQADRGTRFDSSIVDAFVMLYNSDQLALSEVKDARVAQLHDRYGSGALLLSRLQAIKS